MKKVEKLDFNKNLTFGVEIEYINAKSNIIIKHLNKISPSKPRNYYDKWTYSTDPEFCEYNKKYVLGGEVQSAVLKNNRKNFENLEYILKMMRSANAYVNDRTALHYHVSMKAFENNYNYILRFLKLYLAYEHIIYKFGYNGSTPRSVLLEYASPIRDIFISRIEETKGLDFNRIIIILNSYIAYKKYGINFNNAPNGLNTVEFRMCNGSLDYEVIRNEIELFCNLVLSCKKELDEEYLDYRINLLKGQKQSLMSYSDLNIPEAKEFADIIFTSNKSKDRFIKQYSRM